MVDIYLQLGEIPEKEVDGCKIVATSSRKNGLSSGWCGLVEVGLDRRGWVEGVHEEV